MTKKNPRTRTIGMVYESKTAHQNFPLIGVVFKDYDVPKGEDAFRVKMVVSGYLPRPLPTSLHIEEGTS